MEDKDDSILRRLAIVAGVISVVIGIIRGSGEYMKGTTRTFLILTTCFIFFIPNSYSSLIRVVYFVPSDRTPNWSIPVALDATLKAVQQFYTQQMLGHGYNKSFAIEKDTDGTVVVHYVAGKDNDTSYNYLKIEAEVKSRFDISKDIFVVVADLSSGRIDDNCGFADFNGRMVIVPAGGDCVAGDNGTYLIAHELGHSFNLEHNFKDETDIMSYGAGRNRLSKCAARSLNVNPFFNNRSYTGAKANTNIKMLTTNTYPKGDENWKLQFSVTDTDGIHQIEFLISNPVERAGILECRDFDTTKTATVEFLMPKSATILPANYAHIRVIDKKGNLTTKQYPLIVEDTTENFTQKTKADYTYLTLTYNDESALTPTNTPWEWWEHVEFWEQTPDGKLAAKPWGAVGIETHIPYYEQWDYFFYSHAPSEIVYNIEGGNYERFESKFFLPNPCNDGASVEAIFIADGTEIHKTGVLRGHNSQNITISFDIPRGSKKFAITVTSAGDGPGCDHFIFADAKLLHFSETISTERQTESEREKYTDVNKDGRVTIADLVIVASRYGESVKSDIDPNPDVNRDGIVDIEDITLITDEMPLNAAPTLTHQPTQTQLLANYPNPFNPETWIPYQLSKDSDVTITIYDTQGVIVRRLPIGFQYAGFYTNRSRAAHWDGRNEIGEPVASGIYFYQLQTDTISRLGKMLVLK